MKEVIKTILAALLIVSIIAIAIFGHIVGDISYNNGTCKECGGHYHLVTVNSRTGFEYYECDNCGNVIQK